MQQLVHRTSVRTELDIEYSMMLFSGIGYMVGSCVATAFGNWRWGIRVTPLLGVVCLLLIIFVIKEPQRGEAEKAVGATNAYDIKATSYWEDIKAICKM